jgi:hypothetical protein
MPTRAYSPWRSKDAKKESFSRCDSIDDDDNTMTSPKTTRKRVVPRRKK